MRHHEARHETTGTESQSWLVERFRLPKVFLWLWASSVCSLFGDFVLETTLVLWLVTNVATSEPWVAQAVSGVYVASAIPTFLFGLFAGVYVDRRDPRRVRMTATLLSAAVIGALAILAVPPVRNASGLSQTPLLVVLYGVTVVAASLALVMRPASTVLIKDALPSEDAIARAFSYTNVTSNLMMLVAPALASVLFFTFGPSVGLALNALAFVGAFLFVSRVPSELAQSSKPAGPSTSTVRSDIVVGLRRFRGAPKVVAVAIGLGIMVIAVGVINALSIFFLTENLQAPTELFGLFQSFQAAGAIIGAVVGVVVVSRLPLERLFWLSLVGIGITIMVFSRQTSYVPGMVCIAIIGVLVSLIPLALGPIMMQSIAREVLGRVNSVMNLVLSLASVVGLAAGGYLYSDVFDRVSFSLLSFEFGPLSSIFFLCGLLCIAAGLVARRLMAISGNKSG